MDKPSIAITIKFRGVTIEDLTLVEARELRDLLDGIVGRSDPIIVPQPYPVPYWPTPQPYRWWDVTWTTCDGTTSAKLEVK